MIRVIASAVLASIITIGAADAQLGGIASRAFGARTWRETVPLTTDLPVTGNRPGDVRMVMDDLTLWAWNGTAWESIAADGGGGGPSTPTGPAGGDLAGTYPDPTVAPNSVALGTDTTGGYAGSATEGGPATSALTATVATALAANGTNCDPGFAARGGDAAGNAEDCTAVPTPITAHSGLTGLGADDHTQYALLAGRVGGQTLIGGTSSGTLALKSATASPAFTITGSAIIVPASNLINQITGPSEFGIRFGGGNVGNAVGFWFGDGAGNAYFLCDGNTNSCTVKSNAALGWGNASGGSSDQLAMRSPAQGVISITDPATGRGAAMRHVRRERTAETIADNGGGTPATATLTIETSYVEITCADANGCTVTVAETGAVVGQTLVIAVAAGAVTVADTAGDTELAGAWIAADHDTLMLIYGADRWREMARSNN